MHFLSITFGVGPRVGWNFPKSVTPFRAIGYMHLRYGVLRSQGNTYEVIRETKSPFTVSFSQLLYGFLNNVFIRSKLGTLELLRSRTAMLCI